MPDIGETLREARMRRRIDMAEVETATKIRAKYLRALENEEWNLLPGPTYVKSFLRTYAEALGLDAKLLVEEYKLRHERPSEQELRPIGPPGAARRRPEPPRIPRWTPVAAVVVLLLGALFALGKLGSNGNGPTSPRSPAAATTPGTSTATRTSTASPGTMAPATPRRAAPRVVSLQIVPTAPVYVCLTANGNRRLVNKATLTPGSPSPTFRSTRFLVSLGNTQVRLRVGGRTRTLAPSSNPVGYEITSGHVRRVPDSRRPTCGA
jgi:transcriptional regulator with XRE-family HTH domain